jgi:RHS repeat-associated protein
MSRLATIGDGTNTYASYKYLGAGRIVVEDYETLGVKLDYAASNFAAWDRFGRIVDQIWLDYGANPDVVLDEYAYTYDRAGNRLTRGNALHTAFSETYDYDDLDRLISSERNDSHDQSWGLDGLGNFGTFTDDALSQTRTANAANEITGISGSWADPTYDAAGNMLSAPKPGAETTRIHLRYDAWNHLVGVYADDPLNPGQAGDLIASYGFDGVNRRIEKVVADESHVHYFYNQGWQLLEEIHVDGEGVPQLSNQYVWSPRYIDAAIVRFQDGNADGDYLDVGDNVRYYLSDANFNTTAVVDAGTGDVMARYVYDPYGKVTVYSATWTSPSAPVADGVLYCGYFFDAESGFYNVRHREYVTSVSTWAQRDPIAADEDLYRYCGNVPVNDTDANGLQSKAQPKPALSVKEELNAGTIATNQGEANPVSIEMTKKGARPFITVNNLKPGQTVHEGDPATNVNPWLGKGDANSKVGDHFYSSVLLEWVIKFDKRPSVGQWGRNVYVDAFLTMDFVLDNATSKVVLLTNARNDTDPWNDYVSGDNVYMYDGPGGIFGSPEFVFEIWAKSCDGKKLLSRWYYVNGGNGDAYEIDKPIPYKRDPKVPPWPATGGPYPLPMPSPSLP